jgi:hypothetical protein
VTKEIKRFEDLREAVQWLCDRYPSVKGSYKRLVNYFWKYLDRLTTRCEWCGRPTRIWIDDFLRLTPPESITRTYRDLVRKKRVDEPPEIKSTKRRLERIHRIYWAS